MTDLDIHSALVRWMSTRTNVKVIKADQSGDKVPLSFVMVRFLGSAQVRVNEQETEYVEDIASTRIMARPVIEMEWRYSIQAFGGYPSDILRPLYAAAVLAQVNEPLMPGVLIHELSQIRNVPEYINEAWESRAQMDLFLRGLTRDGHLIDTIEQYSFEFDRQH